MPSVALVKDDQAIRAKKGVYILGKDIREIQCLRPSLLYGITGGTMVGLISFMLTSKAAMSTHIGFGSLWVIVFGYWIPCRYKLEIEKTKSRYYATEMFRGRSENASESSSEEEPKEEKKE